MATKNIVLNACKYSEDNHAIISLAVKTNQIIVSVEDKGVGIPQSELENIFQPFFRINDQRATDGFGLGLSLASRIIKLHNGQIQVHSEVQKGTLFVIHFPIQ
jgi:two-component system, OmpR family, sensor histidine kinase ArlS